MHACIHIYIYILYYSKSQSSNDISEYIFFYENFSLSLQTLLSLISICMREKKKNKTKKE